MENSNVFSLHHGSIRLSIAIEGCEGTLRNNSKTESSYQLSDRQTGWSLTPHQGVRG